MGGLSLTCSPPFWDDGRFSPCIQRAFLENLIPFVAIGISILISMFSVASRVFYCLNINDTGQLRPELESLHLSTRHGPFLTWTECILLLAHISIFVLIGLLPLSSTIMPFGLLCLACYSFVVWLGPHLSRSQGNFRLPSRLENHLRALYSVQWICLIGCALSNIKSSNESSWDSIVSLQACLSTAVLLVHISAPKASFCVLPVESSDYMEQSAKESTASLLSIWTFSWAGGIVWKALKTPLEVTDLPPPSMDPKSCSPE